MHEFDDFSVFQVNKGSFNDVMEFLSRLEREIRPNEVARRKSENQSTQSFLLSTALSATESKRAMYRQNDRADDFLTSTWMALVRNKASLFAVKGEVKEFEPLSESSLRNLSQLSRDVECLSNLSEIMARDFGVILIVEPAFPAMRTDGCAMRLPSGIPVIGLSLRYNRYDSFWFTLMHEMAHIVLHYDDLVNPIVDDLDDEGERVTEKEADANRLATDSLVPRNIYRKMMRDGDSVEEMLACAQQAGVHPSIPAGMYRHKKENYRIYSDLVHGVDVAGALGVER